MAKDKKKNPSKTVFRIYDNELSLVTVEQNPTTKKFSITQFEKIPLEEGIIVRGEILKPEAFTQILSGFVPFIHNTIIDILLPHEFFICFDKNISGLTSNSKKNKKIILKALAEESGEWKNTHVFEFEQPHSKEDTLFFFGIPSFLYSSYTHVFEKAGFNVGSMTSDVLAFDHLMIPEKRESLIMVGARSTRVVDFVNQVYKNQKNFQVSYDHLVSDIVKFPQFSNEEAQKILKQYGVLRAHLDEKVYKRLLRSLGPLLEYLDKRKVKNLTRIQLVFVDMPLQGLVDILFKMMITPVSEFHILHQPRYLFEEVLSIHRDDIYQYHPHIAQALKFWKKD